MSFAQQRGIPWSQTSSGTQTSVATQPGVANQNLYVTDLDASVDVGTATMVVKAGSTIIWQKVIGSSAPYSHNFTTPLTGTAGTQISVTVTGTSSVNNTTANASGFIIDLT